MGEAKFIKYRDVQVLRIIFPDKISKSEVLETLAQTKQIIGSQPLDSVYILTFLGGFTYDKDVSAAFKEYLSHNKPYVKASAVVGIIGLKKALYNSFVFFTKRSIKICDTENEGLEYLYEEYKKNRASA
jgi:hypothetical protein